MATRMSRKLSVAVVGGLVLVSTLVSGALPAWAPHGCSGGCMAGAYTASGRASTEGNSFSAHGSLIRLAGFQNAPGSAAFSLLLHLTSAGVSTGTMTVSPGDRPASYFAVTGVRTGGRLEFTGVNTSSANAADAAGAAPTVALAAPQFVIAELKVKGTNIGGDVVLNPHAA